MSADPVPVDPVPGDPVPADPVPGGATTGAPVPGGAAIGAPSAIAAIAVIGLGAMGVPMTRRLLAGHPGVPVRISGRRRRHLWLEAEGARWCDRAADAVAGAQAVLLMLPDLPEVEQVLSGPDGLLAGRTEPLLVLIGSTSSPTGVRELGARLAEQTGGLVRVVDCPVSGGVEGAAVGTLSIMLGGEPDDVALAATVLAPCGRPVPLGPLGAGQVAKACNQMIVTATVLALGEAAVLAERSGLDVATLFDLLAGGYADSRMLQTRGQRIVTEDYAPAAAARYLVKDLDCAEEVARATGTHPVLLPAVAAAFDEMIAAGHGDADMCVTRRFVAER